MECKPAVAVVFHHIGPYHHARLNAAADRVSVTGIEWSAKGYDRWGAPDSPPRYQKVSLFSEATDYYPRKAELRRVFWSALEQANPEVVAVNGWNNFGSLAAAKCCVERGVSMVVMSESARDDEPRTWWKETIKRQIVGLYSAALVGGQRHIEYLVELGMPRDRIFTGYDVVDNAYFRRRAEEVRSQKSEVRQKYGLPENYFLASARFIEKKNLPMLIRAYARYRQLADTREDGQRTTDNRPWDLVLLGDGPLKTDLYRLISDLRLHGHVHLRGFIQYRDLPTYYALADAFVHANTTEQWGLVVNEAMATGLPVIVSNRCGCVPDLVAEGKNGFTFHPESVEDFGKLMVDMSRLFEHRLEEMREESRRIIAGFTPAHSATAAQHAIDVARAAPRCRTTPFSSLLLKALIRR